MPELKISICSDLHLEHDIKPMVNEAQSNVLCLVGDIFPLKHLDKYKSWLKETCSKWNHVIWIMGNHEYYDSSIEEVHSITNQIYIPNLYILHDEIVIIDDVRFIGGTLWTDCNKNDFYAKQSLKRNMNDYRLIKYKDKILTPDDTYGFHKNTLSYIENSLSVPFKGKSVVLTHHAPSFKSIPIKYQTSNINSGFYSDLEKFILTHQPNLWLHGHIHESSDYYIDATRVVAFPRGYYGYEHADEKIDMQEIVL